MTPVPDLVRITKLDTQFFPDQKCTQHVKYVTKSATERRKVGKEEKWTRGERLGRGSFGIVWLERCIQGDMKGEVRAVKKVQKLDSKDYYRELEAIALFSHTNYDRCFVKSFGWYDDDDSIFITMEYLPNGDLHKYLTSPLPETEGQNIVSQILEGLQFMHDNGFAHRDLKPANILIVCKGPDWWVKIADFGVSKRATEELTALRTRTGTLAFTAPEVLGYLQPGEALIYSYTNAVDIWSVGVITFLILTGETLFKDPSRLFQYVAGSFTFASDILFSKKVSARGCDFVTSLMAPKPKDRPGVKQCIRHPWLPCLTEASKTQREVGITEFSLISLDNTSLDHSDSEPSATWSTQDQISAHGTDKSIGVLVERAKPASIKSIAVPTQEVVTHITWNKRRTLKGHSNKVTAVAFSPDGKQIASASGDQTVRLWDSVTGAARATLKGHSNRVTAVAFSPDGKQIASASGDETVRLWDSVTGAARATLKGHSNRVTAVAFSPDGKQIASASGDQMVRFWDSAPTK